MLKEIITKVAAALISQIESYGISSLNIYSLNIADLRFTHVENGMVLNIKIFANCFLIL